MRSPSELVAAAAAGRVRPLDQLTIDTSRPALFEGAMHVDRSSDFDLGALYQALDAQRQRRGITWRQAMREINVLSAERSAYRPIAQSTVSGLRTKSVAEGDGVLQMLRWLGRPPESFIPGCESSDVHDLAAAPADRVLRFDSRTLHAAWTHVASRGR